MSSHQQPRPPGEKVVAISAQKAHRSAVFASSTGFKAAIRSRAHDLQQKPTMTRESIRFAGIEPGSRPTKAGELDEVAARNGDIQAFVPDQGHRPASCRPEPTKW